MKYLVKFSGKLVEEEWDQAATLLCLHTGAQLLVSNIEKEKAPYILKQ